ncbi:MAG: TlyA family RNA methyltransferase [Oscillospiraceae bacterium]|nr:TlyA family RNA methyltransferase [Oscillospiraceae bacterium]
MNGLRLDAAVVELGLAQSRERAKEYIKKGYVTVNGEVIAKPSAAVLESDEIKLIGETLKYVGRGGLKMEAAVNAFNLDLNGKTCVDLGASTGGFTDCMLKNGAKKVYAIDVGHGQLDKRLVNDPKVVNLEGVNVKNVTHETVEQHVDFVSADLSFISCKFAIDAAARLLNDNGNAVILIKPQFEAGKSNISKGGIVKDKKVHISVLNDVCGYIQAVGFKLQELVPSSIKGGDGNIEYLAHIVNQINFTQKTFDFKSIVDTAFSK